MSSFVLNGQLACSEQPGFTPARSMRVLLDARKLEHGGIGVYINNLISGLVKEASIRLTLIANKEEVSRHDWSNEVEVIEDQAKLYSLDELLFFSRRLGLKKFDIFHAPHFTLPFGVNIPSVVTVHDLIHINHPQKSYYPLVSGWLIRSALTRATQILTVSEATRKDIFRLVKGSSSIMSKVTVVPNALDSYFCGRKGNIDGEFLRRRFGIDHSYLLSLISTPKPHKGVEDLIKAFGIFAQRVKDNSFQDSFQRISSGVKLVLVGQGTDAISSNQKISQLIGSNPAIKILGRVSKEDLLHLYGGAQALVVPSLAEGFCLPALEAKACGTPVIARPVPAVMELMDNEDTVAKSFTVEALSQAIEEGMTKLVRTNSGCGNSELSSPLNLTKYGVSETAKQVISVYRNIDRTSQKTI